MHGNDEADKRHREQQGQKSECDYRSPLIGTVVAVGWRDAPSVQTFAPPDQAEHRQGGRGRSPPVQPRPGTGLGRAHVIGEIGAEHQTVSTRRPVRRVRDATARKRATPSPRGRRVNKDVPDAAGQQHISY
jgi:hypothetical protein